ncbi:MAG: hypothetical protein WC802_01045 [Patescibacteria group bacterium]|jgi:hypothetical protein
MDKRFVLLQKIMTDNGDHFVFRCLAGGDRTPLEALVWLFGELGPNDDELALRLMGYVRKVGQETEYRVMDVEGWRISDHVQRAIDARLSIVFTRLYAEALGQLNHSLPKARQALVKWIIQRWKQTTDDTEAERLFACVWQSIASIDGDIARITMDAVREEFKLGVISPKRILTTYLWAESRVANKQSLCNGAQWMFDALAVAWAKNRSLADAVYDFRMIAPFLTATGATNASASARQMAVLMTERLATLDEQLPALELMLKTAPLSATKVVFEHAVDHCLILNVIVEYDDDGKTKDQVDTVFETTMCGALRTAIIAWRKTLGYAPHCVSVVLTMNRFGTTQRLRGMTDDL